MDNIYVIKLITMSILNQLDKLAHELYSEFGFNTCNEEQQEIILQQFMTLCQWQVVMTKSHSGILVNVNYQLNESNTFTN